MTNRDLTLGTRATFDDVSADEALVEWSRAYCRRAVETHDFDVDLSPVEWTVSTRAKRRAAAVKRPSLPDAAVGRPVDWTRQPDHVTDEAGRPRCTVSLTRAAFDDFAYDEWTATLRHELVHVEQYQTFGTTDHGPAFERRADAVDAPIRVRRFATPAYLLSCTSCDDVVARRYRECKLVRRHDEYVSSCCEASLDCTTPE